MRLPELSGKLALDEHGIWCSQSAAHISYPEQGNASCFLLEDESYWFHHRNDCIVEVVKRFPPSEQIVDVGGGNGFVAKRLIDEGFPTVLLEPGPDGAFNARIHRGIPVVICSTLENAGFEPGSVSAIGLFDVLEHFDDDSGFIEYACSLLEPGGLLYASMPAHSWLWSLSDVTAGHFRRYDRKTVCKAFGEGFDILYFTYLFRALTIPVWLLRTLPYRVRIAKQRGLVTREVEHSAGGGVTAKVIAYCLRAEKDNIRRGLRVGMGTSCLVVAQKNDTGQRQKS